MYVARRVLAPAVVAAALRAAHLADQGWNCKIICPLCDYYMEMSCKYKAMSFCSYKDLSFNCKGMSMLPRARLVAEGEHRRARGEEQRAQEVAHLLLAHVLDAAVPGLALRALLLLSVVLLVVLVLVLVLV